MAAWALTVLDTALDGDRLGPVGAAVLLGPDEAPLVGTAGRQAAVPDRRSGGPERLQGRGDRLGDRPVAVPEPPVGRLEVDADAVGHTAGVAAKAGAAPVDRPGGIAGAVDDRRRGPLPAGGDGRVAGRAQIGLAAWEPPQGGGSEPVLTDPEQRAGRHRHAKAWLLLGRDRDPGRDQGHEPRPPPAEPLLQLELPVGWVAELEVAVGVGVGLPAVGGDGAGQG